MEEEKFLIERVGKQNPFKVPEGYFDTLTSQIMAKVDAEKDAQIVEIRKVKKAKSVWLRPLLYAAACGCVLFVSVASYLSHEDQSIAAPAESTVASVQTMDYYSFDEAADYVMIDNQDIYACLSSEY
ncbi:MAG: hypothetical protein J6W43_05620 [Prevotella sp.]|jgi:hypothetical protein|nr:hypothetical protein [Prevotella sp.]